MNTLRNYFAGQSIAGLMANPDFSEVGPEKLAAIAFDQADDMMLHLEEEADNGSKYGAFASDCSIGHSAPLTESKESRLLKFVQAQIKKLDIHCPESIHQCDHVILGAYEFIEGCCEIVGYMETDDESI